MQLSELNYKPRGGQASEVLLIVQLVPISTLCQALNITHFFVLTSCTDLLTIKKIIVKIQTQNNEVYNVLHHEQGVILYRVPSIIYGNYRIITLFSPLWW